MRTLPRMLVLEELDVSWCGDVGFGLWAALPATLLVLRASDTSILDTDVGVNRTASKGLREVWASIFYPSDEEEVRSFSWAALAFSFVVVRVLQVRGSTVEESGVSKALRAMPRLEVLGMDSCDGTGDENAFAVTRHPSLRDVSLRHTSVGTAGCMRCAAGKAWPRPDTESSVCGAVSVTRRRMHGPQASEVVCMEIKPTCLRCNV